MSKDLVYPDEESIRESALRLRGNFYSTVDNQLIQREGCFRGDASATAGLSIAHPNISYESIFHPANGSLASL